MGFIDLERQVFVMGPFRKVSVVTEAQGLWRVATNRNGDRRARGCAKCSGSDERNALVHPQQPALPYKHDTRASWWHWARMARPAMLNLLLFTKKVACWIPRFVSLLPPRTLSSLYGQRFLWPALFGLTWPAL